MDPGRQIHGWVGKKICLCLDKEFETVVICHSDPFWCVLCFLTQFSMPLVLFNTLYDTFLIKFLGKLLDEVTGIWLVNV